MQLEKSDILPYVKTVYPDAPPEMWDAFANHCLSAKRNPFAGESTLIGKEKRNAETGELELDKDGLPVKHWFIFDSTASIVAEVRQSLAKMNANFWIDKFEYVEKPDKLKAMGLKPGDIAVTAWVRDSISIRNYSQDYERMTKIRRDGRALNHKEIVEIIGERPVTKITTVVFGYERFDPKFAKSRRWYGENRCERQAAMRWLVTSQNRDLPELTVPPEAQPSNLNFDPGINMANVPAPATYVDGQWIENAPSG